MSKGISVIEVFGPTIQGEGALAGQVSHFIRLGGCGYRCTWCDTMHAVDPELVKMNSTSMSVDEIMSQVLMRPEAPWVTISGGDPMVWKKNLGALCNELKRHNFKVAIETQGEIIPGDALDRFDLITVSPKPPSSGMAGKFDPNTLRAYIAIMAGNRTGLGAWPKVVFKVAAFDNTDLDWIEELVILFPKIPLYITPGTRHPPDGGSASIRRAVLQGAVLDQTAWVFEQVCVRPALKYATVIPQLHVLAWGDKKGV